MKKSLIIICLRIVCFSLSACPQNAGKTNSAAIHIGKSTKFSEKEIQAAVNCVIRKFKDFKGCDLKKKLV